MGLVIKRTNKVSARWFAELKNADNHPINQDLLHKMLGNKSLIEEIKNTKFSILSIEKDNEIKRYIINGNHRAIVLRKYFKYIDSEDFNIEVTEYS